jgi:hypothetical protein
MKKVISLFQRNYDGDRLVRDEVVPGAEWVTAGEGEATRKLDGTCCMVRGGVLYKRYDAKAGKTPPAGFEPAQEPDAKTGHWPGWLPVTDGPEDRWHVEAANGFEQKTMRPLSAPNGYPLGILCLRDGTYELIGPKIQGNPENFAKHVLVQHGCEPLPDAPRDFAGLRAYLIEFDIEGIVWHHPDGRMVKIKGKDFGIKRGQEQKGGD